MGIRDIVNGHYLFITWLIVILLILDFIFITDIKSANLISLDLVLAFVFLNVLRLMESRKKRKKK